MIYQFFTELHNNFTGRFAHFTCLAHYAHFFYKSRGCLALPDQHAVEQTGKAPPLLPARAFVRLPSAHKKRPCFG